MALPSNTDHPSNGQDTPAPVPASSIPVATTQFPRIPRRWVIGPKHLIVWGACYLAVVTVDVYALIRLATR